MKSVQLVVVAAAAAAAKSLQWYPTLCDPIDSSPPGSPVPGILQERTLEWVAISFSMVVVSFIKIKYRGGRGRWAERIAFKHFFLILCLLLFFFPLGCAGSSSLLLRLFSSCSEFLPETLVAVRAWKQNCL